MAKSEKEKMLAGEYYTASDAQLSAEHMKCLKLLRQLNAADCDDSQTFDRVLADLLPNAPGMRVQPPFFCDYGYNIYTGENTFFNFDCVILDVAKVTIGRNGFFAPKVQLLTATHPIDHTDRGNMLEYGLPITIGDDCWLGGGVIVCPGVTIGDRVVVGAGSVVVHDIPSDSVAVGNPARVVRTIKNEIK